MRLYKSLKKYTKKRVVPMHMPGHKRRKFVFSNIPFKLDITEIEGFDNLHNPEGILNDCQEKATRLFNSKKSFYLVNGSTCGILASIKSCCNFGDKIILPKNCHKSVYHAVELLNLQCVYIPISINENNIVKDINCERIEKILKENSDAKCVFITSPTYEGVLSDIKKISRLVHKYNLPLIVDEAHGSHLFLEQKSAVNLGADIVVNSLHKTLPSLTQTALLHICSNRIDLKRVRHNLSIFMTSSPSYILMSSIDECVEFLIKKGKKYYSKFQKNLSKFIMLTKNLKHLKVLVNNNKFFDLDTSKIVILTQYSNITGKQLAILLRNRNIELEMACSNYALAYSTMFDKKQNFIKLYRELKKIDKKLIDKNKLNQDMDIKPLIEFNINDALKNTNKVVNFEDCKNQVCGEYVWLYPPGVPILIPGEIITNQIYENILSCIKNDIEIKSTNDLMPKQIITVKDLTKK